MSSTALTPEAYLESLPPERREAIGKVREVILKNLPEGYVENMNWGMISYEVPLSVYPDTYNKKPLMYAALASQKNHVAVYLSGIYGSERLKKWFLEEYRKTGKRLDVGKSCVRFKKLDDLPLDLIGKAVAALEVEDFVAYTERAQGKLKPGSLL